MENAIAKEAAAVEVIKFANRCLIIGVIGIFSGFFAMFTAGVIQKGVIVFAAGFIGYLMADSFKKIKYLKDKYNL